jgi:regulator of protease activity HflC (stomatin/prohibitin superfamily)
MDLPTILGSIFGVFLVFYLLRGLKQINQWEVALRFTLGKLSGRIEPGVTLFFPICCGKW